MSDNTTEQKEFIIKEETVVSKEEMKENDSQPKKENQIEKENEEKEKEEDDKEKEKIEKTKKINEDKNDNENEDEEDEEDEDDNELVDNRNTEQIKEEKKEIIKVISDDKENIDNNEKEKEEIKDEKKEDIKEDKKEEIKTEDKNEEKIEIVKVEEKTEEKEEEKEGEKKGEKTEDINEDKKEDKKEEKNEDIREDNGEDKKEEKEEEIKIIKKKITLKQPEENSQKEDDDKNKEKEKELNISGAKKEEQKQKEETKAPATSTRTRYTFISNNKALNDADKAKNNLINEKKNHIIYITIVPSTKKEALKQITNQNQPKNVSKPTMIQNKYNIISQINKTPVKNTSNNTQQQKLHQELTKNIKTEQKPNYQRKYEISKPITIKNTDVTKPKEKEIHKIPENNTVTYISQQKNQNLQKQNQPKANIVNIGKYTIPSTQEKDMHNIKENKTQTNYNQPKKYEIQKPLRDMKKPINADTSKRNMTYANPSNLHKSVNYNNESKYNKKESNPPVNDVKSQHTQRKYPRIKIDVNKYNTEKKPITSNSLFGYNSRTLDNRPKNQKLKYYEKCPNCGYHLNAFVENA